MEEAKDEFWREWMDADEFEKVQIIKKLPLPDVELMAAFYNSYFVDLSDFILKNLRS